MRRLLAHVKGLPPDSAFSRKLAPWRQDHELLATVVDALHRLEYHYITVNGGKADQPDRFPRPGVEQEPPTVSTSEFFALLEAEPHG